MSCISVSLTRVGGISCSAIPIGGINASVAPEAGIDVRLERVGGIAVTTKRVGGISCRMWQECSTNIGKKKYLEIEPQIVWVLNGWTSNDVYSNTTWNVD